MITAACRAGLSWAHGTFQVPAVPDGDACTIARYGSNSGRSARGRASIHAFAAWQAWKYCSSVASAGTSTRVVTPAGESPTAPGGAAPEPVGLAGGRDDGPAGPGRVPGWMLWEQPASADVTARAVVTASVVPNRDRRPHRRTMSIYATLAVVIERFEFCECCRP